jgi:hypothetical protein
MNEIAIFVLGFFAAIGFVVVLASLMALTKEPSKRSPLSRAKSSAACASTLRQQPPHGMEHTPPCRAQRAGRPQIGDIRAASAR